MLDETNDGGFEPLPASQDRYPWVDLRQLNNVLGRSGILDLGKLWVGPDVISQLFCFGKFILEDNLDVVRGAKARALRRALSGA
jgi:hypothetical protein